MPDQVSSRPSPTSLPAMEARAGARPDWHLSLGIWVMIAALQHAEAGITCARCPSPVRLQQEDLQLTEESLRSVQLEFRAEDGSLEEVAPQDAALGSGRDRGSGAAGSADSALLRAKRSAPELAEFGGADVGAPGERGPALDGHRAGRPELRWSREDGGASNPLSSSTFALTGDSAHNHAVVYWSGRNSSVSLTLPTFSHPGAHARFTSIPHAEGETRLCATELLLTGAPRALQLRSSARHTCTFLCLFGMDECAVTSEPAELNIDAVSSSEN